MATNAADARLEQIGVGSIEANPENPRLYFRPQEMEELLDSMRQYGVQVPITVYPDGKRYVLIDGERRWRCASKLNMKTIPALVQERPSRLNNILLMFNIHALREQWDLLTIALKLKDIIDLIQGSSDTRVTEDELSRQTGLSRGVIRRSRYLLDLPEKYRALILDELRKPKRHQKFTEDFFIEMERALRTVERAMPDLVRSKEPVRRVLIAKFRDGTIPNRVHFRQMGKISRAKYVGADEGAARKALKRLFTPNEYGIAKAFEDSVASAYQERDTSARLDSMTDYLSGLTPLDIDRKTASRLKRLISVCRRLLGAE